MNDSHTQRTVRHGLTAAQLKLLAMAIMLVDHIGAFLLTQESVMYPVCRAIGRLAFPIFCYLMAEGARHTRSMPNYMARLAAFAVISTPPYNLVHGSVWYSLELLNVFFTLLLGLMAVFGIQNFAPWLFRKMGQPHLAESKAACVLLGLPLGIALYFAAYALNTDYGGYGVAAIVIFWLLREFPLAAWSTFGLLTFVCYDLALVRYGPSGGIVEYAMMNPYALLSHRVLAGGYEVMFVNARQPAAVLAAIPCTLYNGQKGSLGPAQLKGAKYQTWEKYIFYAFYPIHLLVIWVIQLIF